jgi:hypothetical protein
MAGWRDAIQWQTFTGDPIAAGDSILRPQSQALIVHAGKNRGLVWNRPVAVLVERGGETKRIPILDVTRVAQLGMLGLGSVATMLMITLVAVFRRKTA